MTGLVPVTVAVMLAVTSVVMSVRPVVPWGRGLGGEGRHEGVHEGRHEDWVCRGEGGGDVREGFRGDVRRQARVLLGRVPAGSGPSSCGAWSSRCRVPLGLFLLTALGAVAVRAVWLSVVAGDRDGEGAAGPGASGAGRRSGGGGGGGLCAGWPAGGCTGWLLRPGSGVWPGPGSAGGAGRAAWGGLGCRVGAAPAWPARGDRSAVAGWAGSGEPDVPGRHYQAAGRRRGRGVVDVGGGRADRPGERGLSAPARQTHGHGRRRRVSRPDW